MRATIASLLEGTAARLAAVTDVPRLEAEILLAHALAVSRVYLRAWPQRDVQDTVRAAFDALVERRARGEPIAYITGQREFWSLNLRVTSATLIPRPETETLVERVLRDIPQNAVWSIADLGTGSGAIALAIAHERPRCRVTATDFSAEALAVARDNAHRLNIQNVEFRQGEWYAPLAPDLFHIIVSNPPYVEDRDPHLSQGDLRFEPRTALTAGADAYAALRAIISGARAHLLPGGRVWVEHGYDQAEGVQAMFHQQQATAIETVLDLLGHGRVTGGLF